MKAKECTMCGKRKAPPDTEGDWPYFTDEWCHGDCTKEPTPEEAAEKLFGVKDEPQDDWCERLREWVKKPDVTTGWQMKLETFIDTVEQEAYNRGKREANSGRLMYEAGRKEALQEVRDVIKELHCHCEEPRLVREDALEAIDGLNDRRKEKLEEV